MRPNRFFQNQQARERQAELWSRCEAAIDNFRAADRRGDDSYTVFDLFVWIGDDDKMGRDLRRDHQVTADELARWKFCYESQASDRVARNIVRQCRRRNYQHLGELDEFISRHSFAHFELATGVSRDEYELWGNPDLDEDADDW